MKNECVDAFHDIHKMLDLRTTVDGEILLVPVCPNVCPNLKSRPCRIPAKYSLLHSSVVVVIVASTSTSVVLVVWILRLPLSPTFCNRRWIVIAMRRLDGVSSFCFPIYGLCTCCVPSRPLTTLTPHGCSFVVCMDWNCGRHEHYPPKARWSVSEAMMEMTTTTKEISCLRRVNRMRITIIGWRRMTSAQSSEWWSPHQICEEFLWS